MKLVFNKHSGAVVMSPDSEGLVDAVVAGVGSSTQSSGIFYIFSYIYIYIYICVCVCLCWGLTTRQPL